MGNVADRPNLGGAGMRVFHLIRPKELVLRRTVVPEPAEGEVVARIAVALTCGTDLKTYQRGHPRLKMPGPFGHEWAGSVESVGSGVQGFRPGERIVATPTAPCGDCAFCLRLEENLCLHLFEQMAIGAYGDFILLPRHIVSRNAYRIPEGVSDSQAAFLEPLACVVHGADRLQLSGDRSVVLLGDGPMALLFVQVAGLRGAGRVVLIGRNAQRLQVARQLGTDFVIDARETDVKTALNAITDGVGADTVV
jgi:L-iditol 2-dehydrogenase